MWVYHQSTGALRQDDVEAAVGYSGAAGHWKNNPDCQAEHNLGPIPRGFYTIEKPAFTHPAKGPVVMRLTPDPDNEMFGRASFMIHGDSVRKPGTASEGCLIFPRDIRAWIASATDNRLQVVR